MALTIKDRVKGGDGYRSSLDKFDPKEVAMGLRVELEHSDDPEVALDIVRDHLFAYPKYYTRLKKAGLADELEESKRRERQEGERYPFKDDPNEFVFNVTRPDIKALMVKMRKGIFSKNKNIPATNKVMLKSAILEFINYAKS